MNLYLILKKYKEIKVYIHILESLKIHVYSFI